MFLQLIGSFVHTAEKGAADTGSDDMIRGISDGNEALTLSGYPSLCRNRYGMSLLRFMDGPTHACPEVASLEN